MFNNNKTIGKKTKEKHSKKYIVLIMLLVLNLIFSVTVITFEIVEEYNESHIRDQYTLYVGTNDKDTNTPEITFDECRTRVEKACLQYVSGFTITEAYGTWTDDTGNITNEKTLVCCINGATAADINAISDRLLIELNQSSIMIECQKQNFTYRSN